MKLTRVFELFKIEWKLFILHFAAFVNCKIAKFKVLSSGERRLVETYIVLKTENQMVILDEPFSHLSPLHIKTVKLLISEYKQHKTIIISDFMYQHIIDTSYTIYLFKNGTTKK